MKKTPIKRISAKKKQELLAEARIKVALIERANGHCELCGKRPDFRGLRPHHTGIGASRKPLSLDDKMACGKCHSGKHLILEVESAPMWSNKEVMKNDTAK